MSAPITGTELEAAMDRALALAEAVRGTTSPNPWVGCVVEPGGFTGATSPPGGPHAEVVALAAAGSAARGATLVCTLEPCAHRGRTGPCAEAIVAAGVARVVVGMADPDPQVAGRGLARLRQAGVEVLTGVRAEAVAAQLAPYRKHRATGRPYVVLKLAATLDGRTAAPDGSSRWITGAQARADAHRLRAVSDVVAVGAGTVRADDPALTVRPDGALRPPGASDPVPGGAGATPSGGQPRRQPLRAVFGAVPAGARVEPAESLSGDPGAILDDLGAKGVLQLLVEGGATLAGRLHRAGLVDRYVLYLAPALLGGDDGAPVLAGPGASTLAEAWRGRIVAVTRLGPDVRIDLEP